MGAGVVVEAFDDPSVRFAKEACDRRGWDQHDHTAYLTRCKRLLRPAAAGPTRIFPT